MDSQTISIGIKVADEVISPIVTSANPVIGKAVHLGLTLLEQAEPALYNAFVLAFQGTPLTPEQEAEKDEAIARLQHPEQYFA